MSPPIGLSTFPRKAICQQLFLGADKRLCVCFCLGACCVVCTETNGLRGRGAPVLSPHEGESAPTCCSVAFWAPHKPSSESPMALLSAQLGSITHSFIGSRACSLKSEPVKDKNDFMSAQSCGENQVRVCREAVTAVLAERPRCDCHQRAIIRPGTGPTGNLHSPGLQGWTRSEGNSP